MISFQCFGELLHDSISDTSSFLQIFKPMTVYTLEMLTVMLYCYWLRCVSRRMTFQSCCNSKKRQPNGLDFRLSKEISLGFS